MLRHFLCVSLSQQNFRIATANKHIITKTIKKWKHLCQHFGRAARVHLLPVGCTQVLPPFYRNGLPPNAKIVFAELLCPHVAHLLLHFTLSLMFWDNFFYDCVLSFDPNLQNFFCNLQV